MDLFRLELDYERGLLTKEDCTAIQAIGLQVFLATKKSHELKKEEGFMKTKLLFMNPFLYKKAFLPDDDSEPQILNPEDLRDLDSLLSNLKPTTIGLSTDGGWV